jgi:hypothetical protein
MTHQHETKKVCYENTRFLPSLSLIDQKIPIYLFSITSLEKRNTTAHTNALPSAKCHLTPPSNNNAFIATGPVK